MDGSRVIRFTQEDLDLFSAASGDRNPLHLSKPYASRTAYGQQVVFGALGCLASLQAIPTGQEILSVTADFLRPMFLGVEYRLGAARNGGGVTCRLFDGSTPVLTATVKLGPVGIASLAGAGLPVFPRQQARLLSWPAVQLGDEVQGQYRCDPDAQAELHRRFSIDISPLVSETLLWSSYFVGMELPGESALFFRAVLNFHVPVRSAEAFEFQAKISHLNGSLQQVRSAFELISGSSVAVSGHLTAFVRPEMPAFSLPRESGAISGVLTGKVAVIVGASRGLGACLAASLVLQGAHVLAIARSPLPWIAQLPAEAKSRVEAIELDGSTLASLVTAAKHVAETWGRLDFLVCSAFPAIPSLRLEPTAAGRIKDYLSTATDLVLHPLCAFLPLLAESGGVTVVISSAALDHPVRDWPHYMAAKSAVEEYCRVAPLQFPTTSALILRPERLLTEMTNTPMGRRGAMDPLVFAEQVIHLLARPSTPGECRTLNAKEVAQVYQEGLVQAV